MDQALKDERLDKLIQHASLDELIRGIRAKQMDLHKRITQIDQIELRETISLGGDDLVLAPAGPVNLGK